MGGARGRPVALGDTSNVAARLQGVAAPGSIAVGEATAKRLAAQFVIEPLGEVSVKGARARDRLAPRATAQRHQATDAAASRSSAGMRSRRLGLDRDDLLAGRGQLLLLLGDAGIGKTRPPRRATTAQRRRRDLSWRGAAVSYGPRVPPCFPWWRPSELARARGGDAALAARTRLRIRLEGLLGTRLTEMLSLESSSGRTGGISGATVENLGEDVRRATRALIEALTELMPVALVLEDFQWADPWTRVWLKTCSRSSTARRSCSPRASASRPSRKGGSSASPSSPSTRITPRAPAAAALGRGREPSAVDAQARRARRG